MKKLIFVGALLSALVTLTSEADAQGPGELIAYHACQYDFYLTGGSGSDLLRCDVFLLGEAIPMGPNGLPTDHVGDGAGPVWSRDGMRLAFTGSREPGIFVLNLGDWSRAKVFGGGESPAWSPDGTKLAFAYGELYLMGADGSDVTPLTSSVGFVGQPAWSPDGSTIAFDCEVESGNRDICAIHPDGSGLVRLTSDPASDSGAAFSPDGLTITFTSGSLGIARMNPDGTDVRSAADVPYAWVGMPGTQTAWSPDGTMFLEVWPFQGGCPADGRICPDDIMRTNVAGTELTAIGGGNHPAWALAAHPLARFIVQPCDGLTCTFDGSASWDGNSSASYTWNFGDGTSDTGPTPSHTYAAPGTYSVTLTVTDEAGVPGTLTRVVEVVNNLRPTASFSQVCSGLTCSFDGSGSSDPDNNSLSYSWSFGDGDTSSAGQSVSHTYGAGGAFTVILTVGDGSGATGTQRQIVTVVNAPPTASFTGACAAQTCTFNASGSADIDGMIASYAWNFGDGATGLGVTASHTYAIGGTYSIVLTVVDNAGASSTYTTDITVVSPALHVGDLDRTSISQQNIWTATVTIAVHSGSHAAVSNATVFGLWNDGSTATCITNASGQCAVSRFGIAKKIQGASFSVTNVALASFVYEPKDNHDADGDSNATTISVIRP